jgi:hypothetical protein
MNGHSFTPGPRPGVLFFWVRMISRPRTGLSCSCQDPSLVARYQAQRFRADPDSELGQKEAKASATQSRHNLTHTRCKRGSVDFAQPSRIHSDTQAKVSSCFDLILSKLRAQELFF